ncbi:MAG: hypothetical protein AAF721_16540 [Myxococcota bacterium]
MNRTILTAWFLVGVTGCASQLQPVEDEGGDGTEDLMPPHVADAFERACGSAACHGGTQTPALTAAAAPDIIGGSSAAGGLPFVELGNLQGSYIAIKMLPDALLDDPGARVGGLMPVPGTEVDPADISIILGWIAGTVPPAGDGGATDGMTDGGMTDDAADDTTGGGPTQACGIGDLAPGVDSPVVMGDEADVIPTEIGMIIENNCGCHLAAAEELIMGAPQAPAPAPDGVGTDFTTLAGIRANVENVATRINDTASAMPPPYYCEIRDVQSLTQADFDALSMWLADGAPDGATWTGG